MWTVCNNDNRMVRWCLYWTVHHRYHTCPFRMIPHTHLMEITINNTNTGVPTLLEIGGASPICRWRALTVIVATVRTRSVRVDPRARQLFPPSQPDCRRTGCGACLFEQLYINFMAVKEEAYTNINVSLATTGILVFTFHADQTCFVDYKIPLGARSTGST